MLGGLMSQGPALSRGGGAPLFLVEKTPGPSYQAHSQGQGEAHVERVPSQAPRLGHGEERSES